MAVFTFTLLIALRKMLTPSKTPVEVDCKIPIALALKPLNKLLLILFKQLSSIATVLVLLDPTV